jgi:glucose-1-phosphate cytidylyltransferase
MKVVILAGGMGTRLAEETEVKPKPMVEIGGMPILVHIMKHYAHYGFEDFLIALGYRGEYIKKYFVDYCSLDGNLTIDLKTRQIDTHGGERPHWTVQLVDTGTATMTGGRIKRLAPIIGNETFMMTWGDGVSDVNIENLLAFHRAHGKLTTMTAVRPPARYGHLEFDGDGRVVEFTEKPQTAEGWINGAFFVLEPSVFEYIEGDQTP